MTRPTLPGLVAEWNEYADDIDGIESPVTRASADIHRRHAAELSQAVALTNEEFEALAEMDEGRKRSDDWLYMSVSTENYDTLRALVTRLTAASDGGGKGEGE